MSAELLDLSPALAEDSPGTTELLHWAADLIEAAGDRSVRAAPFRPLYADSLAILRDAAESDHRPTEIRGLELAVKELCGLKGWLMIQKVPQEERQPAYDAFSACLSELSLAALGLDF